jgi:hypothetical protein
MTPDLDRWKKLQLGGAAVIGVLLGFGLCAGVTGLRVFQGIHLATGWGAVMLAGVGAVVILVGSLGWALEDLTYGAVAVWLPKKLGGPIMRRMACREGFRQQNPDHQDLLQDILHHTRLWDAFGGADFYVLESEPGRKRGSAPEPPPLYLSPLRDPRQSAGIPDEDWWSMISAREKAAEGRPLQTRRARGFAGWISVIEIDPQEVPEYQRQWEHGAAAMDVLFDFATEVDGGALRTELADEMHSYHFYGAIRGAALIGSLAGYGWGVARALKYTHPGGLPLLLAGAGVGVLLFNAFTMLGVTYPARRRHWKAALSIQGPRLSRTLLTEKGTTAMREAAANACGGRRRVDELVADEVLQ